MKPNKKIHSVAVSHEVSSRIDIMKRGEFGRLVEEAVLKQYPLSSTQIEECIEKTNEEIVLLKKQNEIDIAQLNNNIDAYKSLLKERSNYKPSADEKSYFKFAKEIINRDSSKLGPQLQYYCNTFNRKISVEEYKELLSIKN